MIRVALIAVTLSIFVPVAAQLAPPVPEIAANARKHDSYPAHNATFPDGVKGIPDVVYWEPVGYRPLTLDLYLPPDAVKGPAAGFPLVIYIHGGAWLVGNSHSKVPFIDFPGVLASLAARGYVVASVNYRLSGAARFPAQIQDVKAAIRWLRINAAEYRIDPARVLIWGASAGGHLAGLAAVSCGAAVLEPQPSIYSYAPDAKTDPITTSKVSDCVQGGVTWYGVFDMSTITAQAKQDKALSRENPKAPEWQLLGCFGNQECTPRQIAAASPVTYVGRDDPPMLLIVGSADTIVPYQQTLEMADRLKAAGVKHQLMVLPGVNHDFTGKTPEQTRAANLKALAATFQFIDQTIGNASGMNR